MQTLAQPRGHSLTLPSPVLQDCFRGVIGADAMGNSCKPEGEAFKVALQRCSAHPSRTAMIEDSAKNLRTAKALGMTTVLVASTTTHEEGASASDLEACVDATVSELTVPQLQSALWQLWDRQ